MDMHTPTKGENEWMKPLCLLYDVHMVRFARTKN